MSAVKSFCRFIFTVPDRVQVMFIVLYKNFLCNNRLARSDLAKQNALVFVTAVEHLKMH